MTKLLAGKRGLIMGVANDHSIAWGIAQSCAEHGAELAFTYQGESFGRRVEPLAQSVGSDILLPCDVSSDEDLDHMFSLLAQKWDRLDFVVHAIAYANKEELKGEYVNTGRENFANALDISCYSFTAVAKRARPMMHEGGSLITLSYLGAERVMPNYNLMGVAKAALEASVRYLAANLGPDGIRVNAISAGPMRTLAGSAIGDARAVFKYNRDHSPLRSTPELADVGNSALYLASDLSKAVSREVHHVDSGFHVIGMPNPRAIADAINQGD